MTKEVYTIEDIAGMYSVKYDKAAQIIRDIKRKLIMSPKFKNEELRIDIRGKIHIQDYNDYFGIKGGVNEYENEKNESI